MISERKLKILAYVVGFSIYIPLLYGMLASWKKPVIFDGDYSIMGGGYVLVWVLCTIFGGLMYREGGMPHFKKVYLIHKHNSTHKRFILQFFFSCLVLMTLLYFIAKAITYPTIESRKGNTPTDIIFFITNVERESYTQTLNRVEGFSYLHKKEIRFPWDKKYIDRRWIDTCVLLKTDGNQWGKIIRGIEKIPRYRCPKINH